MTKILHIILLLTLMNSCSNGQTKTVETNTNKQTDSKSMTEQIDLNKIYPRIKAIWTDKNNILQTDKTITLSDTDSPVYEQLADSIGLFFIQDLGNRFELIQKKHLTNVITIDTLRKYALTNLDNNILNKTTMKGDINEIVLVTNGGNFEAVVTLIDIFWKQVREAAKQDVCFAIPCNDILIIAPKNSTTGRQKMKKLIAHYFDTSAQGLITKNIYEPKDGKFICIDHE